MIKKKVELVNIAERICILIYNVITATECNYSTSSTIYMGLKYKLTEKLEPKLV